MEEGNGRLAFSRDRVSVWEDENVLETDSGDCCTTLGMYLMTLNETPKMANFMLRLFSTVKKKMTTHLAKGKKYGSQ